jgi:uncharacterized protein (TIGR02271 family)
MRGALVVLDDGTRGTVVGDADPGQVVVEFTNGSRLVVPPQALIARHDGTYRLALKPQASDATTTADVVIPVVAEELTVEKQEVARARVRVHKRVETREEVVNVPVVREDVVVEYVPVNKLVDDVVPDVRHEGDVLVVPIIEEVLVVEKRLLVREEARVSKRRTTTSTPQTVVLRREVVDVEREELGDKEASDKHRKDG